eukprot:7976623-Ditylum_brightwellii.AAC.1
MTAGTSSNIEDDYTGYIGTHKEIEGRGNINQSNLIEAPFVESNIILDDDSDNCPEKIDDQIPSSPQPAINLDNFPSIIEIVKGSVLYNVSDVPQDVDSESTLKSMSDATKHAKLDKKTPGIPDHLLYIY